MQPREIPATPGSHPRSKEDIDTDMSMISPTTIPSLDTRQQPPAFHRLGGGPPSPVRFASTTNAFGLNGSPSPSSSTSTRDALGSGLGVDTSPPSAGTVSTRRMRRPSMLSLAQTASSSSSFTTERGSAVETAPRTAIPPLSLIRDPSSSRAPAQAVQQARSTTNPFASTVHPTPRWGSTSTPFLTHSLIRRTSSAPPLAIEALSTRTPPVPHTDVMQDDSESNSPMEMEADTDLTDNKSPLRWMPNHLQSSASRRKGKARMDEIDAPSPTDTASLHVAPFTGRPLPAPLLATLISESSPLEHEMRSEARLQRMLSSHPQALPLTPRVPRSTRGRFPETVGDDDEDDPSDRWRSRTWGRAGSSDSDSDDMPMEDPQPEPVNFAFAAGMDMDRPTSSSSSYQGQGAGSHKSDSNNGSISGMNQNQPTPPSQNAPWPKSSASARMSFGAAGAGMIPSPGNGLGLPNAFGGLGMGSGGTPLASPTIERLELAGSPSAVSVTSPGMMQYRESQGGSASVRPGKRKAQEDRFDPYKRPRGSSPSLLTTSPAMALSPSRGTSAIPIPQSPGHAPLYPSALSSSANSISYFPTRTTRPSHPYTRPMASRSRAASPALSIGSTSGVLSTSLGNNGNTGGGRPSFSLGQAFIPTGQGSSAVQSMGAAPQGLGGLGLLSLSNSERMRRQEQDTESEGGLEMMREDSEMSREAMEED